MTTACEDTSTFPTAINGDQAVYEFYKKYTVGSSGAITVAGGSAYVTLTKESAAGQYSIVCPTGAMIDIEVRFTVADAAVDRCVQIAESASAGTATIQFYKDNAESGVPAAANLGNADTFSVTIRCYPTTA